MPNLKAPESPVSFGSPNGRFRGKIQIIEKKGMQRNGPDILLCRKSKL